MLDSVIGDVLRYMLEIYKIIRELLSSWENSMTEGARDPGISAEEAAVLERPLDEGKEEDVTVLVWCS